MFDKLVSVVINFGYCIKVNYPHDAVNDYLRPQLSKSMNTNHSKQGNFDVFRWMIKVLNISTMSILPILEHISIPGKSHCLCVN